MGTFLSSVHALAEDAGAVRTAIGAVIGREKHRFWTSPRFGRWVSFYPKDPMAGMTACASVSKSLGTDVLYTLVHDSDVFCYFLYRSGLRVDEYESVHGYFGAVSELETLRLNGKRNGLASLLKETADGARLDAILATDGTQDAETQMADLLRLLGIENGMTAYQYLEAGNRTAINRWSEFIHVPDLKAEKTAHRAKRQAIREHKKRLIQDGTLLFDQELAANGAAYKAFRILCADTKTEGFICSGFEDYRGIQLWHPPEPPVPLPRAGTITLNRFAQCIALGQGQILYAGTANGAVAIDRDSGEILWQLPNSSSLVALDERTGLAYFKDREELSAVDWRTGALRFKVPAPVGARNFILHPAAPHLIWCAQCECGIIDIARGCEIRRMASTNPQIIPKKSAQWRAAGVDPTNLPQLDREDILSMDLSADGQLVFVGKKEGLRVYRYSDLIESRGPMPAPVSSVETSKSIQDFLWVFCLLSVPRRNTVIYSGGFDWLREFDCATGSDRNFLPPVDDERRCCSQLTLTRNAEIVAFNLVNRDPNQRGTDFWFQAWNFKKLAGSTPNS